MDNAWQKWAYLSYHDNFYHYFPYEAYHVDKDDRKLLKNNRMVVPTVVLIGYGTALAAEDFLIYADDQSHMTKIGGPTFGSTGQSMLFDLPNGGSARICTNKDTYPYGREFVGYGIQPDIEIKKVYRTI